MTFLRSNKRSSLADQELIREYEHTRDLESLALLFERYIDLVYGVCLKYLKDPDESQDATMQIYEKLATVLFDKEISNFAPWLHVTTKNHCLMKIRSDKSRFRRDVAYGADMEIPYSLHPNNDLDLEADLSNLEKAITKLPLEQKTCIDLFYLQSKCYREISESTGYDPNKVKSFLQNGRRNLRLMLEEKDGKNS